MFPGLSVPASLHMLGAVERQKRQFFRCIINYSGVTKQKQARMKVNSSKLKQMYKDTIYNILAIISSAF